MKKFIFTSFLALILIIPSISLAHPGNTDSSGCHTCRTNCSSWGLSTGEYHCHNNKGTSQPSYPIHSTYGSGGTGYTTPAPDYAYPSYYSSTPSCPLNSYASGDSCQCYSGYVVSGSNCISGSSYCTNKIGVMSSYDSLSKTCECMSGYKLDNSGQCVSQQSYCTNTYGYGAEYSYSKSDCVCKTDYVVNITKDRCVLDTSTYTTPTVKTCPLNSYLSGDSCYCSVGYKVSEDKSGCVIDTITKTDLQLCQDAFGVFSYSPSAGKCLCNSGYEWATDNKSCVIKIVAIPVTDIKFNRTLKLGSSGADVKALQDKLIAKGFLKATPNGTFGPATKAAVRLFQANNGLTADGIAGTTTLKSISK